MIAQYLSPLLPKGQLRRGRKLHGEGRDGAASPPPSRLAATIGPFDISAANCPRPLKPDPTGPSAIATELGIPPARWLYLGDNEPLDMRTATAAGKCAR